ncbi:histidinol-phosphate transaminase [Terrilactibacillus laevilacticus]|uniref:Histidinol-phosphate aminotransferase n=1 Tax=Terrilactibacillus laevilacticus TaxID=1380157 RepID=A0ABW5PNJ6_9BACI|nr:histidinol-phosphate transaminase [Terrilactibacillus laevilacticus]
MTLYHRKYTDLLTEYIPGKSIEEVKKDYHLDEVIRLASNENPLGPSPKAIEAMVEAVREVHLYPEATCGELVSDLAHYYDIKPEEIVTGNGADNLINQLGQAFINEGDEVVYCTPTFAAYRSSTLLMGGKPVEIPLVDGFVYDLDGLLTQITDKTKMIFVCNPNNPTGTLLEEGRLSSFLDKVPEQVLVILDEAYIEFIQEEHYTTGVDFIKRYSNVIVLRTFSKLYGLAGNRVGYAMAQKPLIDRMKKVREVFSVNRVGHIGAHAALKDQAHRDKTIEKNSAERKRLVEFFEEQDFDVTPSHTNFIFVDVKMDAGEVFQKLMEKGVLIRPCSGWGYNTHIRVSIGSHDQNTKFMESLSEVVANMKQLN